MEGYTKIGRIRPNYTGAWNAETAYTVLEMVKNEAGTASYIAKQDVSAGTPLTDEAYWAMVLDAGDVIDAAEKAADRANKAADALGIVPTAAGGVIAVNDASDMPLKGLKLYGKTAQEGTPSPETPVNLVNVGDGGSITAIVCGKNLCPGGTYEFVKMAQIYFGKPLPPGTYAISAEITSTDTDTTVSRAYFDAADGTGYNCNVGRGSRSYGVVTCEKPIVKIRLMSATHSSVSEGDSATWKNVQIERGSVMTEYESYISTQTLTAKTPNGLAGIPVSTGGNYTDENGQQWVCDEIDFERNMYIKRIGVVENYSGETITTTYISSTGALTAGAYIQYILAAPIETPLSAEEIAAFRALHTNKPNTTVYNDSGAGMEVKYVADTKAYIDNKFAALQEAIINA